LIPPHPTVSTASLGVGSPPPAKVAGLATIRLTTTERTDDSEIASVEVDVYGSGSRSSGACSSVWHRISRWSVSTTTVMCRRTSSRSMVGSWCTRNDTTFSPATADRTPAATTWG
jgi:hypothetical protein